MHELPSQPQNRQETQNPFEQWLSQEIREQYKEQAKTLDKLSLLQILPESGEYGIKDEKGNECPFPEKEDILQEIEKNRELYKKKFEQGFTELQITPFALPLKRLFQVMERTLLAHHKEGMLFTAKKDSDDENEKLEPLDLDTEDPLYIWDEYKNREITYFPKNFTEDHEGKTKEEVIKESAFPGFLVSFHEQNLNIPREGKGGIQGGRQQLEANKKPEEYLKLFQDNPQYEGESGVTIEEWIILFTTHLEKTNQIIDDYSGNGSTSYNLGSFFLSSRNASRAVWGRGSRQAGVGRVDPRYCDSNSGARGSVRVGIEV